jgi:hypothetical protein
LQSLSSFLTATTIILGSGLFASLLADEAGQAPRPLTVPGDVRPIAAPESPVPNTATTNGGLAGDASTLRFLRSGDTRHTAAPGTSLQAGLRWRGRSSSGTSLEAGHSDSRQSASWQDRNRKVPYLVQPASHQQAVNPLDDPFGDKSAPLRLVSSGNGGQPYSLTASADAPTGDDAPAPPDVSAPKSPLELPALPAIESTSEPPARKTIAPSLAAPTPAVGEEAPTDEAPCKRIYNDRNCCDEDEKCTTARQALHDNLITTISLDITAPFKPDAQTDAEEQEARETQMRLMPARAFRNRAGETIATGRVTDIRNRRIQITDENGNETPVRLGQLSDDDLCFLAAWWGVPTECTLGDIEFAPRGWEPVTFAWKASALCHKPLYFEEAQLERYGHSMGPFLDPLHSGAHFFLNVAVLPYKMGINPPLECQYALGYYRPGSCAPWLVPPIPISVRGGLMEAGAVLGLIYLIP